MAETVYALCAVASLACAALLLGGYRRTRARLLLWSGICFVGLGLNNVLVFVDLVLVPTIDFSLVRSTVALAAMLTLLWGLVWEVR